MLYTLKSSLRKAIGYDLKLVIIFIGSVRHFRYVLLACDSFN